MIPTVLISGHFWTMVSLTFSGLLRGLNMENGHTERIFRNIGKKFPPEQITRSLKMNGYAR